VHDTVTSGTHPVEHCSCGGRAFFAQGTRTIARSESLEARPPAAGGRRKFQPRCNPDLCVGPNVCKLASMSNVAGETADLAYLS